MTKYVYNTEGNFDLFVETVQDIAENISSSTTYEDGHRFDNRTVLLVYERYSAVGNNRVTLSIAITKTNEGIQLVAISSGGSQAIFFKINTWGEETFLSEFSNLLENINKTW